MTSADRFKLPIAVQVLLLCGEDVLMLRRFNTGYADGLLGLPAGHLERGETVVGCAIREAREEVGVVLDAAALQVVAVVHRRAGTEEYMHFFVAARDWGGEILNCEPGKCSELRWCSVLEPPGDTVPEVRDALAAHARGEWFFESGW